MLQDNNKFLTFGEKMDKSSTQSDERYIQDLTRISGNQVGTALREPNNKALHQATLFSTGIADYLAESEQEPKEVISDALTAEEIKDKLKLALKATVESTALADSNLVHTINDESIDGRKDFAVVPRTPLAPVEDSDIVNKKYVDATAQQKAETEAGKIKFDPLLVYPVGAIYMSVQETSPAVLFGGSWKALDQGRVLIGASVEHPAGETGGESNHVMSLEELPSHTHAGSTNVAGSHTHTGSSSSAGAHTHGGYTTTAGSHTHGGGSSSAGSHTHTGSASSAGSHLHGAMGEKYNFEGVRPDFGYYSTSNNHAGTSGSVDTDNTLWNTSTNGSHSHYLSISSAGSHSHSMSLNNAGSHSHGMSLYSAGEHNHTMNLDNGGDHSHTLSISNTGNSKAFNVMQPFLSVYMWQRVA